MSVCSPSLLTLAMFYQTAYCMYSRVLTLYSLVILDTQVIFIATTCYLDSSFRWFLFYLFLNHAEGISLCD